MIVFIGIPINDYLPKDKELGDYCYFYESDGNLFGYGKEITQFTDGQISLFDVNEFNDMTRRLGKQIYIDFTKIGLLSGKHKFPSVFIIT